MRIRILYAVGLILALSACSRRQEDNSASAEARGPTVGGEVARATTPAIGDDVVLKAKGTSAFHVLTTLEAFEAYRSAIKANDEVGIEELVASKQLFVVSRRTTVKVLEIYPTSYKVRIVSGPHERQAGWIAKELVAGVASDPEAEGNRTPLFSKDAEIQKQYETELSKLGSIEQRRELFRRICESDDLAIWQANRIFTLPDFAKENSDYISAATDNHRSKLINRLGLSKDQLKYIETEALARNWTVPEYPSCDTIQAARDLEAEVDVQEGSTVYHRTSCALVKAERAIKRGPLSEAIRGRAWTACEVCKP